MKKITIVLSLILAIVMLFGTVTASAVYVNGDKVSQYTVYNTEVHNMADGLTFNEFSFKDTRGVRQTCYTMEYNPATTPFRSYIYHTKVSYGYRVSDDAANAQAAGLKVYGAVNGDFFSMNSNNYGTPDNMFCSEGKLKSASITTGTDYKLYFSADGSAHVVQSKLKFSLSIGGTDYSSSFGYINKRSKPTTPENKFYYFDNDVYNSTPSLSSTKFIVCTYNSGEIGIGDTLNGTVSAITTSGGTALTGKNFVLMCGSGLGTSGIKVGDKVAIKVEETISGSKAGLESAQHVITARFVLVHNGVDRWKDGNGEIPYVDAMTNIYAHRTVFGLKPDGSIIYMVCDGWKYEPSVNGLTFTQIVEMMLALGCTEVVNLDGDGSSNCIISEGNGAFNHEYIGETPERTDGNSILIIRDPNAAPEPEKTFDPMPSSEGREIRNVALNKTYTLQYNGLLSPTFVSGYDDSGLTKLTDGNYRPNVTSGVSFGLQCRTDHRITATLVFDLGQYRDDIRDVKLRSVNRSTSGGNRGFNEGNFIVYVSDDKVNWHRSVDYDLIKEDTANAEVYDYTAKFKESKGGRYVKLVVENEGKFVIQLDEVEVHAMVDTSEPADAENPPSSATNAAQGGSYKIYKKGEELTEYYNASTQDTAPPTKLTDGNLGTSGGYGDGCTVAFISGTGSEIQIKMDLGETKNGIEFVQLLHMIDNQGSFAAPEEASVEYSSDGKTFSSTVVRKKTSLEAGTSYVDLTLQLTKKINARYVNITFNAPKYLFGIGEVKVLSTGGSAPEPEIIIGDINGDEDVDSSDAAMALKYDAGVISLTESQLSAGDVSGDKECDSSDAALILKYDSGVISEFPKK